MNALNLKPNHAPVKAYYETLEKFSRGKFDNEGNIRVQDDTSIGSHSVCQSAIEAVIVYFILTGWADLAL